MRQFVAVGNSRDVNIVDLTLELFSTFHHRATQMTFDDRITGFSWKASPRPGVDTVMMHIDSRLRPGPFGRSVSLVDPPTDPSELLCLLDRCIWGVGNDVMLGGEKIGTRVSYSSVRLDPNWLEAVCRHDMSRADIEPGP